MRYSTPAVCDKLASKPDYFSNHLIIADKMVLTNNILACNTCQTVVAQNFGNSLNGLLNGHSEQKDGVDSFADVKAASHEQTRLKIKPYKAENIMLYFYTYIMNIIKNILFPWMGTEQLNVRLEQSGSKGASEDCYSSKSCFDENEKMIVLQENTSKANFCDNSSVMRNILTDFEILATGSNSTITSYIEPQANEMKRTQTENSKNLGKDFYGDIDNIIMEQPFELALVVEKQIEENEDKLYKLKSVRQNKRKKKSKKRRKRKNSTEDSKKNRSQSLQSTPKGNCITSKAKGKHQQNCCKKSCLDFVDTFAFPTCEAEQTSLDLHLQMVLENDKNKSKLQLKPNTISHIIDTTPLILKEQVLMPVPLNVTPAALDVRFGNISECESEDSFIVFGFDDDEIDGDNYENLSDHGSDVHSLEESDMEEVDDELPATSRTRKKKVRFAKGDELCKVHHLVMWSYAYQAARKGPWEEYARDRERFAIKILNLEPKLDKVLDPKLRQRVYRERFAD